VRYFAILKNHLIFYVIADDPNQAVGFVRQAAPDANEWGDLNDVDSNFYIKVRRPGTPKGLLEFLTRVNGEVYLCSGKNIDDARSKIEEAQRVPIMEQDIVFLDDTELPFNLLVAVEIDPETEAKFVLQKVAEQN